MRQVEGPFGPRVYYDAHDVPAVIDAAREMIWQPAPRWRAILRRAPWGDDAFELLFWVEARLVFDGADSDIGRLLAAFQVFLDREGAQLGSGRTLRTVNRGSSPPDAAARAIADPAPPRERVIPGGPRIQRVLAFATELARSRGGYFAAGVAGWMHPDNLRTCLGSIRWGRECAHLARLGDLDTLPPPAAGHAEDRVYRISERGVRRWAEATGNVAFELDAPDGSAEPGMYVPPAAEWALAALRDACSAGDHRGRIDGRAGWLTAAEISARLDRWNDRFGRPGNYRVFDTLDLRWLLKAGLCERRIESTPARTRPVHFYRVTPEGDACVPLRGQDGGSPWPGPELRTEPCRLLDPTREGTGRTCPDPPAAQERSGVAGAVPP